MTTAGGAERPARYAVIGHPVAHSRSPWIHARFAQATGERLTYEKIDAPPERFEEALREFFAHGGRGVNVTLPHKEAAFALADRLGAAAREAGAVNTLRLESDGSLYGDNTDGAGLVRDLTYNLGAVLADRRILLLGAGGAARGSIGPLLRERPRRLLVVNRTAQRARDLARAFAGERALAGGGFELLQHEAPFDVVINATSAGIGGDTPDLPPGCVRGETLCYDMLYGSGDTPFMTWARRAGAGRVAGGSGMLVEQAAESFLIWRGRRPATADVLAELELSLGSE